MEEPSSPGHASVKVVCCRTPLVGWPLLPEKVVFHDCPLLPETLQLETLLTFQKSLVVSPFGTISGVI